MQRDWRWWTLGVVLLGSAAWAAPAVTVVRSTLKLQPGLSPPLRSEAVLFAARNESEAFQILLVPDSAGLSQVVMQPPTLTHETSGVSLPTSAVRVYRLGPVHLTKASGLEGGTGDWPDPLIPATETEVTLNVANSSAPQFQVTTETRNAFPRNVPSGDRLIAWVEVHVPEDARAGRYQGTVRIDSPSLADGSIFVPVTLTVWDFTLPSTSSLATTMPMSVDRACRSHMGTSLCPSLDALRKMNALYARFFLQHRITVQLQDNPNTASWPGTNQAFLQAYGPLLTGVEPDAALSAAQRLKSPRATSLRYPWYRTGDSSGVRADKASHWWNDLVVPNGWKGINFDYTADEPGYIYSWDPLGPRADEIHAVSPEFRTFVTSDIKQISAHGVTEKVNVMTPVVYYLDAKPNWGAPYQGNQRSTYDGFLALPGPRDVWTYVSCQSQGCVQDDNPLHTNWPSFIIDAMGLQNRAQPWMNFIYDVHGLYYYEIVHRYDGIASGDSAYSNSDLVWSTNNGNGTLVYPGRPQDIGGTSAVPVASYRLKMLRDGLEDYEYLKLCEAKDSRRASSIARGLFPMSGTTPEGRETGSLFSADSWPNPNPIGDAERLEQAREALADCIVGQGSADGGALIPDAGAAPDAGGVDAGAASDSGMILDAGVPMDDAGSTIADAGNKDAGSFDAGSSDGGSPPLPPFAASWTVQTGTSGRDFARAAALDAQGQLVVVGDTSGSFAYSSSGGSDVYLLKRSSTGKYVWSRQSGTSQDDVGNAVAVDGTGNVYVVGTTAGSLRGTNQGGTDIFIASYSGTGVKQWGKQWGSSADDVGVGVAVDPQGRLWIAGHTSGSLGQTSLGQSDWVLVEVNASGTELRRIQFGTSAKEVSTGVAVDSGGSVFLSGWKEETPGATRRTLVKLSGTGSVLWQITGTENTTSSLAAVAVDGSGASYVTGQLGDQLLVEKYLADGTQAWSRTFGALGDRLSGRALRWSSSGQLFIAGAVRGSTFGTGAGGDDAFLSQHSPADGALFRAAKFGSAADDAALGLASDAQGHVYVVGVAGGALSGSTTLGREDLFLRKY